MELSSLVEKRVIVHTVTNKTYTGMLLGYNVSNLSVVLGDVEDEEGKKFPRVIIYGHTISDIVLIEQPLDLAELARRLEEVFPKMVKYIPDARLITVMDRVRVTEKGVEGSGPVAQRVKDVYEKFMEEWREKAVIK